MPFRSVDSFRPTGLQVALFAASGPRDRQVLFILPSVDGGDPVHLCGLCRFVLGKPGEPCPPCAQIDEDVAAEIDSRRVVADFEKWLRGEDDDQDDAPAKP